MIYKRTITILVSIIVIFSTISCLAGLLINDGPGEYEYLSINNETIQIYGKGLYKLDSVSAVAQGKASDVVTLILAVPMLVISLLFSLKGSFKAKLLLSGTLGYFLYTYMSYTFLWMYNPLFLIYVALMSSSLFAFILSIMSFDIKNIHNMFDDKLPVKFLGGFELFIAFTICALWLGKIIPSVLTRNVPSGLEHYTTLVIQGMDLGLVVPAAIVSAILLFNGKPFGFLLSSVIILKGVTILASITAMIINMMINGVTVSIVEIIAFGSFDVLAVINLILLMSNIKSKEKFLN